MRYRMRKLLHFAVILSVMILGLFLMFRQRYRGAIMELARTQITNGTSDLINDAIDEQIETGKIQYDRIVYFEKDLNGRITALNQYVGMLAWVGAGYILWLAWHMLRSSGVQADKDPAYPTFRTGLLVQLTNVKIMIYCLSAMASFVLPYTRSFWALLAMGIFLPFTGPVANLVWLFAGASLQKLFVNHRKTVDIVMAISLALCAVSLVWPH